MFEFFRELFATDFMPHGHCYFWRPEIVWLHVVSDGLIALAYFIIPLALIQLVRKRRDLAFNWMFVLFGVFILACGTTHIMSIWTLWIPVYRLDGVIKAITALASVPTAMLLIRLVPQATALPSPALLREVNRDLEKEVLERKMAEARIRQMNAELEQRVAERTRELSEANAALQRMNEDLKHFAYAASHDLQEPLRNVVIFNQLLARDHGAALPGPAQEYIRISVGGAVRMQELLDGLRAYWEASERGVDGSTDVACEDAVKSALLNLQRAVTESGAQVTFDALPVVRGEQVMFVQLFQNLIGNSIKYRGSEAPRIHIGAEKRELGWLFSVADNGLGIDPEYHEAVFGVFKRLHGRDYAGVGIGLALCRKVVERYGGRIWVESEGGHGSVFRFTIPAKKEGMLRAAE